ncbi:MAG: AAA family ATPase, partial [Victivallaceae bacterium]|nr:AAA family ATPase [Victivallaceae bacterium]
MANSAFDFDFANIVNRNLFYIDKTEYLWNLINSGGTCFFMSRPRRFGKSLTVSTLKYIFEGRKELFKGLAFYGKPYDWKKHPVIHLDMTECGSDSADKLERYLHDSLQSIARRNNLVISGDSISVQFRNLIEDLASSGNQVVILLDEYDKPILNNISKPNLPEIFNVLKSFYATIKKCNPYERFVFITGVSKFSHVSIFSDLNNLKDISMDPDYATMLGFTQEELEENFGELIEKYANEQGMTRDEMVAEIRHWYNGYRFHPKAETVYNPVSATSFFEHGEFLNFWIKTGLSGFLM